MHIIVKSYVWSKNSEILDRALQNRMNELKKKVAKRKAKSESVL